MAVVPMLDRLRQERTSSLGCVVKETQYSVGRSEVCVFSMKHTHIRTHSVSLSLSHTHTHTHVHARTHTHTHSPSHIRTCPHKYDIYTTPWGGGVCAVLERETFGGPSHWRMSPLMERAGPVWGKETSGWDAKGSLTREQVTRVSSGGSHALQTLCTNFTLTNSPIWHPLTLPTEQTAGRPPPPPPPYHWTDCLLVSPATLLEGKEHGSQVLLQGRRGAGQ